MKLWRVLLAFVIAAALPLQGIAAASMLFCGQMQARPAVGTEAKPTTADASHAHHAAVEASPRAQADSSMHDGDTTGADCDDQAQSDHRCPICAVGCHNVALVKWTAAPIPVPFVQARTDGAGTGALAIRLERPDKPPRS